MLSDLNGHTARTMTRSSSPDRGQEWFDTDDVHNAREVVGKHLQRHLSRHFGQRLHQKVRRPHPHLQRAKRMLDRLAVTWPPASTPWTWKTDLAMSKPMVVIVCMARSSESWEP